MGILLIAAAVLIVGADQLVKYWAVHYLQPKGTMEFIHFGSFKVFDLTYLENRGAIFGKMADKTWFTVWLTAILIAVCIFIMIKSIKRSKFLSVIFMMIAAGGIGNLIDRVRLGYVVDMFEWKPFHFAIFNVADIFVTVSIFALLIYLIIDIIKDIKRSIKERKKKKEQRLAEEAFWERYPYGKADISEAQEQRIIRHRERMEERKQRMKRRAVRMECRRQRR